MKRRLVVEMESGASPDSVAQDVFNILLKYADFGAAFSFRQELVPEKTSGGLSVPAFVTGGVRNGKANC